MISRPRMADRVVEHVETRSLRYAGDDNRHGKSGIGAPNMFGRDHFHRNNVDALGGLISSGRSRRRRDVEIALTGSGHSAFGTVPRSSRCTPRPGRVSTPAAAAPIRHRAFAAVNCVIHVLGLPLVMQVSADLGQAVDEFLAIACVADAQVALHVHRAARQSA